YYEQCLQLEREIGFRYAEAHTLQVYGETLLALNVLDQAADTFRQALALRRELEQATMHLLPPQLGLVHVAYLQQEMALAQTQLLALLPALMTHQLDGLGDPFGLYWRCYGLLVAYQDPRAPQILALAYQLLQEQADKIPDADSRQSFLQNVPEHRELVRAMAKLI
ncbi:MAG: hypothetical protein KC413_12740, partial [Anaerolineales bacterium]|nr:hypothetical protein [Anaerolineales bacterium]